MLVGPPPKEQRCPVCGEWRPYDGEGRPTYRTRICAPCREALHCPNCGNRDLSETAWNATLPQHRSNENLVMPECLACSCADGKPVTMTLSEEQPA